jgi:CubicO group peptidase (beta-lactamase class C family)
MRWMHLNAQQIFPTANVYRHGPVRELDHTLTDEIGAVLIDIPAGPMPFDEFIASDHSTAMGVVILHKGKIVFEQYPRMKDYEKPIYWSVAKVMPATIIRMLEEEGRIDVGKPIDHYIKDLSESAFAGITIRNILDMASGLDCGDEYEDRQSCYYQYTMGIGDGFREGDAPDNPYDYLKTLEAEKLSEQGTTYSYSGVNTFILGWLVEELTGYAFNDVFTREIWQHIGAEADASFVAYRYGIPLTHGGFLSNLRDLARFGLLFTPSYPVVSDKKIISDAHIKFLLAPGNPLLRNENGSQSIYQWNVSQNGNMKKGGWGGQGLLINPERDIVAVFASYFKDDYSEVPLESAVIKVLEDVYGSR